MSRINGELTHELSMNEPKVYNALLFKSLGERSCYGALAAMRNDISSENIDDHVALDPNNFHSESLGGGFFVVGTQPMSPPIKSRLLFQDERFTYPDEATYRFTHELMHPLLADAQHHATVRALTAAAMKIRDNSDGALGLTTLGSLDHYEGDKKVTEDATELMTMFAWSPDYFEEYANFLANPKAVDLRRKLGLVSLSENTVLYDIVSSASEAALGIERR
jgi:hypothetical protein